MTPKDRVRANIYKTLLEEEKRKNKKISLISVSLFVVGIFTGSSYDLLFNGPTSIEATTAALGNSILRRDTEKTKVKGNDWTLDHLFGDENFIKVSEDFNTEKLFVSDLQI